jgi:hypothetical protein
VVKDGVDVDLWAAGNTYMQIGKAKINKFIDKFKDLFPWRWNATSVWALIECVYNNISRAWRWEVKHSFETFCHCAIAGLPISIAMCRIKTGKHIKARIRASRELHEERM